MLVGAAIAHDADGADGEDGGEGLGGGAVEIFGDDFFEEDFVGLAEDGEFFGGDFADAADGEAGAGEGVAPDDVFGEAEEEAEFADFVFEEVAEGFDEVEAEFSGEAADVVVELDVGSGAGVAMAGFDDVGIEGALGEEFCVGDGEGFAFEDVDEDFADDFAFLLRVGDVGEGFEEVIGGVDDAEIDFEVIAESGFDGLAFVFSEEAVVDEDAGELGADGFVEECGEDGGIDATGEAADDVGGADLLADGIDGGVYEVAHFPGAIGVADAVEEVFEDLRAVGGVGDFGVELDADEGFGFVGGGGEGAGGGGGEGDEVCGELVDLIAVGHPDGGVLRDAVEEVAVEGGLELEFDAAVFAGGGGGDASAEDVGEHLHAVADAEDGEVHVKDGGVALGCAGFVDGGGAAREDDADGVEGAEFGDGDVGAYEDGVDAGFADAAGDELDVLAAEIEDGNSLTVGDNGFHAAIIPERRKSQNGGGGRMAGRANRAGLD